MRAPRLVDGDGAVHRGRRRHDVVQRFPRPPAVFLPVPTRHAKSASVPIELSSFVGREAELAQIAKVQSSTRLLTLVGPGGVGKSRLALRLASASRETYADRIWFIEFAAVTDPDMVPQTLADAIGARAQPGERATEATARVLRARRVLLILDNCEHLVSACSELADWLLRKCPALDIIATSREPLKAVGDIIWRVPPMSLPAPTASDPRDVAGSEAIQLFVERAKARDPTFKVTSENVRHIVSICRRLDGLPLALELAAARVGSTHEAEIAARLGLDLVSQRDRSDEPGRQQTLRATLDWSYQLLAEADRTLLRRLAVFADGWSLNAAETVCADDVLPYAAVLEGLERLVARSLVMLDRETQCGTYYLLETVKEYARERLDDAHETAELRRRHLAYVLALAEGSPPEAAASEHAQLLAREQDNVRAALSWAVAEGNAEAGLRLAIAAYPLWHEYGHLFEGRVWLERLLALPLARRTPARARGKAWLGRIALMQGDLALAEASLRAALREYAARGDQAGLAFALLTLGSKTVTQGDMPRAKTQLIAARLRMQESANPGEFSVIWHLAIIAVELGELEHALELAAEARVCRSTWRIESGVELYLQGIVAVARGDALLAAELLGEARDFCQQIGEHWVVHEAQRELAHVMLDLGRNTEARECIARVIDTNSDQWPLVGRDLEAVARYVAPAQPSAALRLAGAADELRAARGARAWPSDQRRLAAWLPGVRHRLRASMYIAAWESGRLLGAQEALTFARGLVMEPLEDGHAPKSTLTRRERDVLMFVACALSNQQIASELNISVATTRTHVDHILAKLGLHSRTQLAIWANDHDLR